MKLFDFALSGYEELLSMYPSFYREIYEIQEILKAQGKLADTLKTDIQQVFFNQFIDYADSETLAVYEKIIGIEKDISKTLSDRRRVIKAFFTGSGKMSETTIKNMIGAYTHSDVECSLEKLQGDDFHTLLIDAELRKDEAVDLSEIIGLIAQKLPAHLAYILSFYVNVGILLETTIERYITGIPKCGVYACGQAILF